MSDVQYQEALNVAQELTNMSDDALFEELGRRIQDMQNVGGYQRSHQFSADFAQDADDMLSVADLKKIGKRWWQKLEPALMEMLCEKGNEDMKKITGGKTIPQIAASLATASVVSTFAPPAWVIVATSVLAIKISETGLEAICETWQESLEKA